MRLSATCLTVFLILASLVPLGCEDSPEHRMGMATIAMRQGNPNQALDYAKSVLRDQPDNIAALTIKGKAELRLRQYDAALKSLNQLIEHDPENVEIRRELARWAYSKMAFTLSKSDYMKDGQLSKDFAEAKTLGHRQADWLASKKDTEIEAEFIRARLRLLDSGELELHRLHEIKKLRAMVVTADDTKVTSPAIEDLERKIRAMKYQAERHLENVMEVRPDHFDSALIYIDLVTERDGWSNIWELANRIAKQKDTPPVLARGVAESILEIPDQFKIESERMALAQKVLDTVSDREAADWALIQTRIYMLGDQQEKAYEVAEKLFRKQPDDSETRYNYGWTLYALDKHDLAKATLASLAAEMRNHARVQSLYGRLLIAMGDKRGAIEYLRRAVELDPKSFHARAALVEALADNEQSANAALEDIRKLYEENPSNPTAIRYMMQALISQDRQLDIPKLIDKILQLSPLEDEHVQTVVIAYTYLRQFDKAVQYAKELTRRKPHSIDAQLVLASVYLREGKHNDAKRILQQLHAKDPESESVNLQLTRLYMNEGQFDQAVELMEKVLEESPNNIDARINLARSLTQLQLTDDALQHVNLVLEQEPKEPRALELAARIYRLLGQFEKADIHMQQIDEAAVDPAKYPGVAAKLMLQKGYVDDAMAICDQAITSGKASVLVRQVIVEIQLNEKKDLAQGEIHLLAYAREHPNNIEPFNLLAKFYIKHNKDRGLLKLRELRDVNETLARLAEAQILTRYGRLSDAITTLAQHYPTLIKRNERLTLTYAYFLQQLILKRDNKAVANAVPVWEALISSGVFRYQAEVALIELTGRNMTPETFTSRLDDLASRIPTNHFGLFHKVATYLTAAGQFDAVLKHVDRWLLVKPDNASLLGMKADALRYLNRFDDAVKIYNQAMQVSLNPEPLHIRIIETYQAANDFPAMEAEFDRWAARGSKEFIAAMWSKGTFYNELGITSEAAKTFERLNEVSKSGDPRVSLALGQAYASMGRFKDAQSHLASIPQFAGQYPMAQVMLARIEGRDIATVPTAKERLQRLMADPKLAAFATRELMTLAKRSRDMQQILEWADGLIASEQLPEVIRARWLQVRANVKADQRDWIGVNGAIDQFLELTPDNQQWQIAKIILLVQTNKLADAQKFFDDHPKLHELAVGQLIAAGIGRPVKPVKSPALDQFLLALIHGQFDQAGAAIDQIQFSTNGLYRQDFKDTITDAKANPKDIAVYRKVALAAAARQIGFRAVADAICTDALKTKPNCALAHAMRLNTYNFANAKSRVEANKAAASANGFSIGHYLTAQSVSNDPEGDLKQAVKAAEALVQREPDHYPSVLVLTGIYLKAGEDNKALDLLTHWSQKPGRHQGIVANDLAYLLATKFPDKLDQAHQSATLARKLLGDSPGVLDTLGWIEHLRGNHDRAIQLLSKAWVQISRSSEWHQHMSKAYAAAGNDKWSKYHEAAAATLSADAGE